MNALQALVSALNQQGVLINAHTARLEQHDHLIALLVGVNVATLFWLILFSARMSRNK